MRHVRPAGADALAGRVTLATHLGLVRHGITAVARCAVARRAGMREHPARRRVAVGTGRTVRCRGAVRRSVARRAVGPCRVSDGHPANSGVRMTFEAHGGGIGLMRRRVTDGAVHRRGMRVSRSPVARRAGRVSVDYSGPDHGVGRAVAGVALRIAVDVDEVGSTGVTVSAGRRGGRCVPVNVSYSGVACGTGCVSRRNGPLHGGIGAGMAHVAGRRRMGFKQGGGLVTTGESA